jgi:hypothetical protein
LRLTTQGYVGLAMLSQFADSATDSDDLVGLFGVSRTVLLFTSYEFLIHGGAEKSLAALYVFVHRKSAQI